jgi:type IV secretory pathway TraG/TraD family ATPase VirD4
MEIADIQNVVGILVDPLGRKAGDLNFWDQSATDFFTAIILHVLYSEEDTKKNLAQVRRLLINIDPTLHAMKHTKHRHGGRIFMRRTGWRGRRRQAPSPRSTRKSCWAPRRWTAWTSG